MWTRACARAHSASQPAEWNTVSTEEWGLGTPARARDGMGAVWFGLRVALAECVSYKSSSKLIWSLSYLVISVQARMFVASSTIVVNDVDRNRSESGVMWYGYVD